MPSITRSISKNNIDLNSDTFPLTAAQKNYIETHYFNTGKVTEEKSVTTRMENGVVTNKMTLTLKFRDNEALDEYLSDPQIQAIKSQADEFYSSRGVVAERSANFDID